MNLASLGNVHVSCTMTLSCQHGHFTSANCTESRQGAVMPPKALYLGHVLCIPDRTAAAPMRSLCRFAMTAHPLGDTKPRLSPLYPPTKARPCGQASGGRRAPSSPRKHREGGLAGRLGGAHRHGRSHRPQRVVPACLGGLASADEEDLSIEPALLADVKFIRPSSNRRRGERQVVHPVTKLQAP